MGRVAQPSAHTPPPVPLLTTGVTSPPISRLYTHTKKSPQKRKKRPPCRRVPCREARGSGVAVDRCALFGVVRAGSVLLPGLSVVDRWVGHDCFTCVRCCLRPHTITPLPWRERGIQFPQPKNKHTSQARGDAPRTGGPPMG
eukprot:scaffold11814_cov172-Isochrysis_galbana.AAC.1